MLVAGNIGMLNQQEINAIATLMQQGKSMRQAKRILGITKKQPPIQWNTKKS
jgi:hypothetical protein